jgi:HK97 family phage major capsid protein
MFEVKALDEAGKIGGYGVRFTGPEAKDLQGDYFTPETDVWLESYPVTPLLYQHGQDETLGNQVIGKAVGRLDREGVWYEAQLNLRDKYEKLIYELVKAGKLGYSTGSVSHLVRREADGKLLSWPVVEVTLTPNPAAGPYLTRVETVKASYKSAGLMFKDDGGKLKEEMSVSEEIVVEETQPEQEAAAENLEPSTEEEKTTMDEQTVTKMINEALKPYLEAQPRGGYTAGGGEKPDAAKAFGLFLRTGKAEKALEAGVDGEGGYIVPEQQLTELVKGLTEASLIRQAGARVLTVNSDLVKVPSLTNSAAAVLTDEEAAYSEVDPSFGQITFTPFKFTRLVKVSEELVNDAMFDVWGQALAPDFLQAFAAAENSYLTTGTGTGQPQGVVTGAGVGKTAASATAITADELIDLYHSLGYL